MQLLESGDVVVIPENLRSVIQREHSSRSKHPVEGQSVEVGDIRQISSGSLERLVLVLRVIPKTNTSLFTLVHSYEEFATEYDVVVEPGASGLPYSIVVQSDLRAAVSTAELGRLVAKIPSQIVDLCLGGTVIDAGVHHFFVGAPLIGPLDARWDFKVEEGEIMREISSSVIEILDSPEAQWMFEFEVFSALLLPVEDSAELAIAVLEYWHDHGDQFLRNSEYLLLFEDRGLLDRDVWSQALGNVGVLFFDAVMRPFLECLRSTSHESRAEPTYSVGLEDIRELQNA